jgi:hypothetical protein
MRKKKFKKEVKELEEFKDSLRPEELLQLDLLMSSRDDLRAMMRDFSLIGI